MNTKTSNARFPQDLDTVDIFKALRTRSRMTILRHLRDRGAASVADLGGATQISATSLRKHLEILSDVRFVERKEEAYGNLWQIRARLHPSLRVLVEHL